MDNILYLDEYINLYNKKNNKLIVQKLYKNTLLNGLIIDKEKFILSYKKILTKNNYNNNFFCENILVITNNLYKNLNKQILKEILEVLGYKKIKFVNELDYLKLEKNKIFINYNFGYFYILYLNKYGNVELNLYKNDYLNKSMINELLKNFKNHKIFIYGKNYQEIENILKKKNLNYYFFEESDNLLINMLISNKNV